LEEEGEGDGESTAAIFLLPSQLGGLRVKILGPLDQERTNLEKQPSALELGIRDTVDALLTRDHVMTTQGN
jgi:hypothetical protein